MLREINKITQIVFIILSGILLSLSFPNFNLEFAAWFAFVPLFFALEKCTKKEAFFLSYLCGLVFFGLTVFWVHHVSILGYILLILILSTFFGLFGLFLQLITYNSQLKILMIPTFWVTLEYIRSHIFTGFGWALLGHSQYLNLPAIQISDITGAYGVSFLVMMVNVMIYNIFKDGLKKSVLVCLTGLFIIGSVFGYGYLKLNDTETANESINISLIQGNIPQSMKWDSQHKDSIFKMYSSLTEEAGKEKPDLIIWPETALPGFMEEKDLLEEVKDLAEDVNTYILVGAPSWDFDNEVIYNTAFLFSKDGEITQRYDKLHLVPFGEYVPFGKYLDFIRNYIDKPIGEFAKGDEYTIFELENGLRFGVLICFEDIFSNLVRNFVIKNADFVVNITNDAWFMKTGAPYQHAQSSVFRAVENRVPVIRAANTGLSCFIDKYGKIMDSVKVDNEEIFIAGYKTKRITLSKGYSFYKDFGDVFAFLCIMIFIINGGLRWLKKSQY